MQFAFSVVPRICGLKFRFAQLALLTGIAISFSCSPGLYAACLAMPLTPAQSTSTGDELPLDQLQSKIYSAVARVSPAVVAINDRGSIFSGVIASKDGLIVSAGHAVRPGNTYRVTLSDGRRVKAEGLGADRRIDMALLKITDRGDWPVAELGQSSALRRYQPCIGISHPSEFNRSRGAVVRFGYVIDPVTANQGMIKSTAKMEPGDSGGPLIDLDGKVIGIHSNIRQDAESNYDVPIDSFREYWDELQEPEWIEVKGIPSLPTLGFRGDALTKPAGIEVFGVTEGSLAEQAGLETGDIIVDIGGQRTSSIYRVKRALIKLRSESTREFEMTVLRDNKRERLKVQLLREDFQLAPANRRLASLEREYAKLESKLDDNVFQISSRKGGQEMTVYGTRIVGSSLGNLISKDSRVGESPSVELPNGETVAARIVARDRQNDLVLLAAALPGTGGVELGGLPGDMMQQLGKLLLTPSPDDSGLISVWGSRYFSVPRTQASGGYLGVQLAFQDRPVQFERVFAGAAKAAGLKAGDVLVKLNDREIKKRQDVFDFLKEQDPSNRIKALIKRDDQDLTKEIVLNRRPDQTGHVADDLEGGKSIRRDGFQLVISHDANLVPERCGGPVYDLQGEFLGINISRYSRTQAYVLPKSLIRAFVEKHR